MMGKNVSEMKIGIHRISGRIPDTGRWIMHTAQVINKFVPEYLHNSNIVFFTNNMKFRLVNNKIVL